ncbi:hypothetical protein [Gandjariella thermophila]|uniref:Uncharacterized protein n=1 Tax=Gandjariella thermophila TaxID=1931992 RepID=A0A4D4JBE6_9PSEU|nr:hypothetical protein [Gandjariella thermophila]GDY32340.1 hypothetical protein GTS_39730 [Gandjariella thermophila]
MAARDEAQADVEVDTLVVSARRLRWRAPELALVLSERAAALAGARRDEAERLRAEALAVSALNRLGRGMQVVDRTVRVLRAAEAAGQPEVGWEVRVELAANAKAARVPMTGFALLRPVLAAEGVPNALRATALMRATECLVGLGRSQPISDALDESDRRYAAAEELDGDTRLLLRGQLHAVIAAHQRRWGDLAGAIAAARDGLALLDQVRDRDTDSGEVLGRLVLELVCALMDSDEVGEASRAAEPMLDRPVRAPFAASAGWLRLALATRVHLPAGRLEVAQALLRDTVDSATRHQLDDLLTEALLAVAHVHETRGELSEALAHLRSAHAAERRQARIMFGVRARLAEGFVANGREVGTAVPDQLAALLRPGDASQPHATATTEPATSLAGAPTSIAEPVVPPWSAEPAEPTGFGAPEDSPGIAAAAEPQLAEPSERSRPTEPAEAAEDAGPRIADVPEPEAAAAVAEWSWTSVESEEASGGDLADGETPPAAPRRTSSLRRIGQGSRGEGRRRTRRPADERGDGLSTAWAQAADRWRLHRLPGTSPSTTSEAGADAPGIGEAAELSALGRISGAGTQQPGSAGEIDEPPAVEPGAVEPGGADPTGAKAAAGESAAADSTADTVTGGATSGMTGGAADRLGDGGLDGVAEAEAAGGEDPPGGRRRADDRGRHPRHGTDRPTGLDVLAAAGVTPIPGTGGRRRAADPEEDTDAGGAAPSAGEDQTAEPPGGPADDPLGAPADTDTGADPAASALLPAPEFHPLSALAAEPDTPHHPGLQDEPADDQDPSGVHGGSGTAPTADRVTGGAQREHGGPAAGEHGRETDRPVPRLVSPVDPEPAMVWCPDAAPLPAFVEDPRWSRAVDRSTEARIPEPGPEPDLPDPDRPEPHRPEPRRPEPEREPSKPPPLPDPLPPEPGPDAIPPVPEPDERPHDPEPPPPEPPQQPDAGPERRTAAGHRAGSEPAAFSDHGAEQPTPAGRWADREPGALADPGSDARAGSPDRRGDGGTGTAAEGAEPGRVRAGTRADTRGGFIGVVELPAERVPTDESDDTPAVADDATGARASGRPRRKSSFRFGDPESRESRRRVNAALAELLAEALVAYETGRRGEAPPEEQPAGDARPDGGWAESGADNPDHRADQVDHLAAWAERATAGEAFSYSTSGYPTSGRRATGHGPTDDDLTGHEPIHEPSPEPGGYSVAPGYAAGDATAHSLPADEPVSDEPGGIGTTGRDPVGAEPGGSGRTGLEFAGRGPMSPEPGRSDLTGLEPAASGLTGPDFAGPDLLADDLAGSDLIGHEPAGHEPAGYRAGGDRTGDGSEPTGYGGTAPQPADTDDRADPGDHTGSEGDEPAQAGRSAAQTGDGRPPSGGRSRRGGEGTVSVADLLEGLGVDTSRAARGRASRAARRRSADGGTDQEAPAGRHATGSGVRDTAAADPAETPRATRGRHSAEYFRSAWQDGGADRARQDGGATGYPGDESAEPGPTDRYGRPRRLTAVSGGRPWEEDTGPIRFGFPEDDGDLSTTDKYSLDQYSVTAEETSFADWSRPVTNPPASRPDGGGWTPASPGLMGHAGDEPGWGPGDAGYSRL